MRELFTFTQNVGLIYGGFLLGMPASIQGQISAVITGFVLRAGFQNGGDERCRVDQLLEQL